jgi:NADH:ubiquinone oxidoreductase subunit 2 (subunit N)
VGSMGESNIKKILILSSLFTGAWIFRAIGSIKIFWLVLLIIYRAILFLFLGFIRKTPISQIYINSFYMVRLQKKIIFFSIFLSIAGLPPSTGFFIKFIISRILLEYDKYILLRTLVFRTVALIYMYLRIFFLRINFSSVSVKHFLSVKFFTKEILLIPLIIIGPAIFLVI